METSFPGDFKLKVFESVARNGGFSAAARELSVTQAAVSRNVAELERIIGESLFVRSRERSVLTPAGESLLSYAKRILYLYDRIDKVLVKKSEAPDSPTLLKLSDSVNAEVSVFDGDIRIKVI